MLVLVKKSDVKTIGKFAKPVKSVSFIWISVSVK